MELTAWPALSKVVARLVVVALVAFAFGMATQWSVQHLPRSVALLSSTAAPWVLLAFLLALMGSRVAESFALAIVALVAMVLGFYLAQALRGWGVPHHQIEFWCLGALVFGPLVGLAAGWLRHSGVLGGSIGAGVIGGLLVGEAVFGLTRERVWTPAEYWHVQLAVGIALAVALTLWSLRHRLRATVVALCVSGAVGLVVSLLTLAAYQTF